MVSDDNTHHRRQVLAHAFGGARAALATWAAALAGAGLTIAVFYPGYMSFDSLVQLWQARTGLIDSWHPPLLAWIWRWLDLAAPGPIGMLVFQNAMFWAGLGLLVGSACRSAWARAVAILGLGLFPPVFALLGTIWKDVQMGAALVLALGCLRCAVGRPRWPCIAGAIAALLYAGTMRHNAITAVAPLVFWWATILPTGASRSRSTALAIGVLVSLSLFATSVLIERALVPPARRMPVQYPFVHDLVAISIESGRDELPPWVYAGTGTAPIEYLRRLYRPDMVDTLIFGEGSYQHVTSPVLVQDLRARWLDAVRRHPKAWLRHRWAYFHRLLGSSAPHLEYQDGIDDNTLGVVHPRHTFNRAAMSLLANFRGTLLFRGWVWLLVLLGVFAWAVEKRRATPGTLAILASALCYLLPYFFIGPSDDFRYIWWLMLAAVLMPFTTRPTSVSLA